MVEVVDVSGKFAQYLDPVNSTADWCVGKLGVPVGEYSIELHDEEGIKERNLRLLGHNYATDVISSDWSLGKIQVYEIYLGIPVILENAAEGGVPAQNELLRCLVHGFLHLRGMDDRTEELRAEMRRKEDEYMKMFHVEHHE